MDWEPGSVMRTSEVILTSAKHKLDLNFYYIQYVHHGG